MQFSHKMPSTSLYRQRPPLTPLTFRLNASTTNPNFFHRDDSKSHGPWKLFGRRVAKHSEHYFLESVGCRCQQQPPKIGIELRLAKKCQALNFWFESSKKSESFRLKASLMFSSALRSIFNCYISGSCATLGYFASPAVDNLSENSVV